MRTLTLLLILAALSLDGCAGSSPGVETNVTTGNDGTGVSIGVGATGDSTEAIISIQGGRP